ncbi:hypothetical protein HRR90_007006 [Exophiala dermatitidis]|nr:hypothetical protein HRR81_006182 [Exophiala dermatitidis]KAJ4613336.1 hypothetical protein HRR86_008665 [Exophiala dermatitidis]KAJ4616938.1 hypothetical protein HRR88_007316 [Exophiala dermatitidis]KAJ4635237.1 hypothetical protein HRR89_007780 [Exophiala dermatitidis]KAJ4646992.1 hypothetical protein HRR90_007006 [Exophiala dermatitidis]
MEISNNAERQQKLEDRHYIRYDDPRVTSRPEGEEEDIKAVADMVNEIQKAPWNSHRHCYTGTHARTQGIVKGTLSTEPNLPAHLKQSMFAEEREWPVLCRYSSEPGDPGLDVRGQSVRTYVDATLTQNTLTQDRIPQPRGFAMKVFDVHGEHFDAGKGLHLSTQDIEFNSTPALDLADAKTTREIIDLRIKFGNNQAELYKQLDARKDTELQKARDARYGDYVIKYCLVPNTEIQRRLYDETVKPVDGSDILHRWLQNFHREHDAEYLFQVQLCENLEDQPVEYAGKVWDPEKYPWQTVARLTIPKQDSFNYALKCFWEDRLRVDPWLGLKSLEPLGGPNRLRKVVYPASSALRRKMNATTEFHIKSLDELPAH